VSLLVPAVAVLSAVCLRRPARGPAHDRPSFRGAFKALGQAAEAREASGPAEFDFVAWADGFAEHEPLRGWPFTPTLSCEPALSRLMGRFDWQLVPRSAWVRGRGGCGEVDALPWDERTAADEPEAVWAAPHALERLLAAAAARGLDRDPARRERRVVVFSGTEMPLSAAFGRDGGERNATVRRLRMYFGRILYQAKDIRLEHVRLAPHGLCWACMYAVLSELLRVWRAGGAEAGRRRYADFAALFADGGLGLKTRGVLLHEARRGWLDDPATPGRARGLAARGLLFPPGNSSLRAVAAAWESRERLRRWGATPAAAEAGVEARRLGPLEWWGELSRYRFLLAPMGSGIQSAKPVEALMVLTVPIVQRIGFSAYDELAALGFPVVVVEGWVEVTRNSTAEWWRRLSPRLESFRRNCLSVEGYWRLYTGAERCA